jgi:hypothetical protein
LRCRGERAGRGRGPGLGHSELCEQCVATHTHTHGTWFRGEWGCLYRGAQGFPAASAVLSWASPCSYCTSWGFFLSEDTGKTLYFPADGWFVELAQRQAEAQAAAPGGPAKPTKVDLAAVELALPRATNGAQYKVVVHVLSSGKGRGIGIDGKLQFVLLGMSAEGYHTHGFEMEGRGFSSCQETRLVATPQPLGQILSLEVSCAQAGILASRLRAVEVGATSLRGMPRVRSRTALTASRLPPRAGAQVVCLTSGRHALFLPPSGDDEQLAPGTTRLVMQAVSAPHFRIACFTAIAPDAGTDATVYVDLFGAAGQLLDLHLADVTGARAGSGWGAAG